MVSKKGSAECKESEDTPKKLTKKLKKFYAYIPSMIMKYEYTSCIRSFRWTIYEANKSNDLD